MPRILFAKNTKKSRPVWAVSQGEWANWLKSQPASVKNWLKSTNVKPAKGTVTAIPGDGGGIAGYLLGLGATPDPFSFGALAFGMAEGAVGRIETLPGDMDPTQAAVGFALGSYQFDRYKKSAREPARLVLPAGADGREAERVAEAVFLARDLVNTPAGDMGPNDLEVVVRRVAKAQKAKLKVTKGEALLKANLPMIHAVGRASIDAPRLLDLSWGDKDLPKVTLVGKGVCFDSGGLNIKGASGMLLMKKDMGGGANALALAQMIMAAGLKVRLRLLIPAVENAISSNAYHPGDILTARNGISVQIDNTDAEGRVVLADALVLASEEKPDLLIDLATLTGAARVALGWDVPAFYCNDEGVAAGINKLSDSLSDPLWRMPLWSGYEEMLESTHADITNAPGGGWAGSITAALFLQRFVGEGIRWMHMDISAWNQKNKPGRPKGGEAMTIRAIYALIRKYYGE